MRKAVVLAAGEGTRLRPWTLDRPKVMLDVAGRPLLQRHVEWLKPHGVEEFYFNLHYLPEAVTRHFGDGSPFGVKVITSTEETLQGTAGALRAFRPYLDSTFLVHYGDVYSELDVAKMLAFHREKGAQATLVVHETSHPHDSDIVELGPDARVIAVHHKPGSDRFGRIGNAACYILEPRALDFVPPGPKPADFCQDVFPAMIAAGEPVYGYDTDEFLMDMGTPDRYEALRRRLSE
jgi:NDP-sugar pyrophosphorylase family protein